jgi:hypothetical protein
MHQSRGQFSGPVKSRHMHSSGACIANMSEFEFLVHTVGCVDWFAPFQRIRTRSPSRRLAIDPAVKDVQQDSPERGQ